MVVTWDRVSTAGWWVGMVTSRKIRLYLCGNQLRWGLFCERIYSVTTTVTNVSLTNLLPIQCLHGLLNVTKVSIKNEGLSSSARQEFC
jgi:hypothetical protein